MTSALALGGYAVTLRPQNTRQSDLSSAAARFRCWRLARNSSIAGPIIISDTVADARHSVHHASNSTGWKTTNITLTTPSGPTASEHNYDPRHLPSARGHDRAMIASTSI